MEESQILRIIPGKNIVDKRGNEKSEWVKKKINTTKRVKGASILHGILVILIGTSANDFLFCAQKVSVWRAACFLNEQKNTETCGRVF